MSKYLNPELKEEFKQQAYLVGLEKNNLSGPFLSGIARNLKFIHYNEKKYETTMGIRFYDDKVDVNLDSAILLKEIVQRFRHLPLSYQTSLVKYLNNYKLTKKEQKDKQNGLMFLKNLLREKK